MYQVFKKTIGAEIGDVFDFPKGTEVFFVAQNESDVHTPWTQSKEMSEKLCDLLNEIDSKSIQHGWNVGLKLK